MKFAETPPKLNRRDFLRVAAATAVAPRTLLGAETEERNVIEGFGVGLPHQWAEDVGDLGYYARALAALDGADWWLNWFYYDVTDPALAAVETPPRIRMKYAMCIDEHANPAMLKSRETVGPWLIGNEQARKDQADIAPDKAAEFSRFWADMAMGAWAAPGELLGVPETYQWLDGFFAARGEIGAYAHAHCFPHTVAQLRGLVDDFKRRMKNYGYDRPLILSEVCSSDPSLSMQMAIMDEVRHMIADGSLIAAAHYSSRDPFRYFSAADLLDANGALTQLGKYYVEGSESVSQPELEVQAWLPTVAG